MLIALLLRRTPPITLLVFAVDPVIVPANDTFVFDSVTPPMELEVVDKLLNAPFDPTIGVPDTLIPTGALIVPLLNVMLPADPTTRMTPDTSSALPGAVVPIPIFALEMRIRSTPPAVHPIVFAPGKNNPVVRSAENV